MAASRCCNCNGSKAKCVRCHCSKNGLPCSSCCPGDKGACQNPSGRDAGQPSPSSPVPRPRGSLDSDPNSNLCSVGSDSSDGGVQADQASPSTSSSGLPSLSAICRLQVPLLYHVPKAARNSWSGLLSAALEDVVARPSDLDAWSRLFMLPKCVLFLPPFRSRRRSHDLLFLIKQHFQLWRNGEVLSLWAKVCDRASHLPHSSSQSGSNIRRARHAVEAGHFSKAIQALSSCGLAPHSHESYMDLLSKHPQCSPPSLPPVPSPPSVSSPPLPPPTVSHSPLSSPPSPIPPPSPSSPPLFSSPSPTPPSPPSPPLSPPPLSLPLLPPSPILLLLLL